jgi:hypothetical protein
VSNPQRNHQPAEAATGTFGYFLVRVRRAVADGGDCTGIIERIGTGEKREFRDAVELARLVEEWSQ